MKRFQFDKQAWKKPNAHVKGNPLILQTDRERKNIVKSLGDQTQPIKTWHQCTLNNVQTKISLSSISDSFFLLFFMSARLITLMPSLSFVLFLPTLTSTVYATGTLLSQGAPIILFLFFITSLHYVYPKMDKNEWIFFHSHISLQLTPHLVQCIYPDPNMSEINNII